MRRSTFFTEPISCEVEAPKAPPATPKETEFEKPRGVASIELRTGFAQVHVHDLEEPVVRERIRVLKAIADVEISLDFLKLTPTGLSFLISSDKSEAAREALLRSGVRFELRTDRTILLVHAVNIRDEEGLIAEILHRAIGSGAPVDHVGDMHDRVLMILRSEDAPLVRDHIAKRWPEAR